MSTVQDSIAYFLDQHEAMDSKLEQLEIALRSSRERKDAEDLRKALKNLLEVKEALKRHFKEEEKALFPALEPHIMREGGGFMVLEHPGLMAAFNELRTMMEGSSPPEKLYEAGLMLISVLKDHSGRENSILHTLKPFTSRAINQKIWKELEEMRAGL